MNYALLFTFTTYTEIYTYLGRYKHFLIDNWKILYIKKLIHLDNETILLNYLILKMGNIIYQ